MRDRPLFSGALISLLFGSAIFSAPCPAQLPPDRVLVLPPDSGDHVRLGNDVGRELEQAIRDAGFPVVDIEQAKLLAQREQAAMKAWFDQQATAGDAQLALLSRCEVVVRLDVEPVRQRKEQGRYTVEQRATFRITFADSAEGLGSGEGTGKGRTLDGYDSAHRQARKQLCAADDDNSLTHQVLASLRKVREQETANGARLTIALYIDNRCSSLLEALGKAVAAADGVVAGSYQPLRTFPSAAFADGQRGTCNEVSIRHRGGVPELQTKILESLREIGKTIEAEHGFDLQPTVIASGRRLDVVINVSPSATALADEVQRVVRSAVDTVYGRYSNVLAGKRLAVVPASIGVANGAAARLTAFRRAFRQTYDATEARLQQSNQPAADPLTASGSVKLQDTVFANLAEAKGRLFELEEAFYGSSAGSLANDIGAIVEKTLDQTSEGKVKVQPMARDRDRAVDFIRLEAAASTEDGSVSPDSIAFYEQKGSEFLVSTRLRRFLDEFVVTVNVTDLSSGTSMQGTASFHPRFTAQLQGQLGS